jgi:MYXO-CTERM domain-containing protein
MLTMDRWKMLAMVSALFVSASANGQTIDGTLVGDESFYGTALSIQDTRSQFGDADTGDPSNGGRGSELDQVFAKISGGKLIMLIAGNLESNFNKLQISIDSVAGGVNTIDGANLPGGHERFCCGGFSPPHGNNTTNEGALQKQDGLTFDSGFGADYSLIFTNGFEKVNPGLTGGPNPWDNEAEFWSMSAYFADLTSGSSGAVEELGMALAPQGRPNVLRAAGEGLEDFPFAPFDPLGISPTIIGPALPGLGTGELIDKNYAQSANGGCDVSGTGAGCIARELEFALPVDPTEVNAGSLTNASSHRNFDNTIGLLAAIDNSNTAGVLGSAGPDFSIDQGSPAEDDPENVVTGVELAIPLAAIGNPTGDVKITAFINGSSHDFLSNQFAGDGLDDGPGDPDGLPAGNPGTVVFGAAPLATLADFTGDQFITVSQSTGLVDGDYSGNGIVDAADYTVWFDHRGAPGGPADGDGNGTVDQADYTYWKTRFGNSGTGTGKAVPEPAALLLALLGLAGLLARRR